MGDHSSALIVTILAFYFVPTIVALLRLHRNATAIVVLNILLGWTLVGWVVALVWSMATTPKPTIIYKDKPPR